MAQYMLLCYHEETDAAEGVEREAELPLMLDRYTHLANEAGLDLQPYANLRSWFERVEQQPGYIEDVMPHGANAAPGAGTSIYD